MASTKRFRSADCYDGISNSKAWDKIVMSSVVGGQRISWNWEDEAVSLRSLPKYLRAKSLRAIVLGAQDEHLAAHLFTDAKIRIRNMGGDGIALRDARQFIPRGMMLCGIAFNAEYEEKVQRDEHILLREVGLVKQVGRYGFPTCEIWIDPEKLNKNVRLKMALFLERLTSAVFTKNPRELLKFLRVKKETEDDSV